MHTSIDIPTTDASAFAAMVISNLDAGITFPIDKTILAIAADLGFTFDDEDREIFEIQIEEASMVILEMPMSVDEPIGDRGIGTLRAVLEVVIAADAVNETDEHGERRYNGHNYREMTKVFNEALIGIRARLAA